MKNQIAVLPSLYHAVGRWITASAMALAIIVPATALPSFADSGVSQQLIPILGLTTDNRAIGTVAYLALSFEERSDRSGLIVHFQIVQMNVLITIDAAQQRGGKDEDHV